ncbi:hypothetical protein H2198_005564 [Neophaeococcomyces mojaviensis]|uniref:Uncharacterized protein n=1 Tax=Neophaeococcomyces mojaviensis TaxID=3383035 RepID=A0ACC3A5F3_9EURO|nr:hypothetical protein H2198_005564 [Knufia sp. JES_112]
MVSFRSLLAVAPLLATVLAKVGFTNVPQAAVAGNSYNISWAGGDDSAVTLTLRRGNPQNLATISTIADRATGSSYIWTIPSDIPSGDDYALQITQGQSDINYSGLFSISGTSSNSTSSTASAAASTTRASNSTMAITSAASASGTGTAMNRNSTFSTATLTSSNSDSFTFGSETSTATRSSASRTSTSQSTSAPSNDAPVRTGASSAALILGIVAAVMLH